MNVPPPEPNRPPPELPKPPPVVPVVAAPKGEEVDVDPKPRWTIEPESERWLQRLKAASRWRSMFFLSLVAAIDSHVVSWSKVDGQVESGTFLFSSSGILCLPQHRIGMACSIMLILILTIRPREPPCHSFPFLSFQASNKRPRTEPQAQTQTRKTQTRYIIAKSRKRAPTSSPSTTTKSAARAKGRAAALAGRVRAEAPKRAAGAERHFGLTVLSTLGHYLPFARVDRSTLQTR